MNGFTKNLISYFRAASQGMRRVKDFRLSYLGKVFSILGKREKIIICGLAVLAAVSLAWSIFSFYFNHTKLSPAVGGSYTEGMVGQPVYINPLLAHTDTDIALTKLIYSGLYKYNNQGTLTPDLAETMPMISEDQKQYTISLKKNVKWHNDKNFTADDVIFTIQTLKDVNYKSPFRSMWLNTNIEKVNDYQIKFTTKDTSGPFINNLTIPILPKSVWGNIEASNFLLAPQNLQAVGTGPYVIREIKKLSSGMVEQIKLESFSNFYEGKPNLDIVVIKFYDSGENLINAFHSKEVSGMGFISLNNNLYIDENRSDINIAKLPIPYYQVLFFNLKNKILSDIQVRQALSLAINKQAIVQNVFNKNAKIVNSFPFSNADTALPFNIDKAALQLDGAGWTIDPKTDIRSKKNIPLSITIATNDFLLNSKAAEEIANQWKKLHIQVSLTILPTKQLSETLVQPRTFDVLIFPQKLDADPDPFAFWHSSQIKDPGLNLTGFSNPTADKLISEARASTNTNLRNQKYKEFQNILIDQAPAVFLNQTLYIYAISKEIKNVGLENIYDPSQRFYDTRNWYTDEKRIWK